MDNALLQQEQRNEPLSDARYFGVSTQRFATYLLVSSGIWIMYWFYRNWQAINRAGYRKQFNAFWRAIFCIYTAHSLTGKILQGAKKRGYGGSYDPKVIGIALIVLGGLSRGMDSAFEKLVVASADVNKLFIAGMIFAVVIFVTALPALVLAPVNQTIDFLKQQQGRQKDDDNHLTGGQILIFTFGVLIWLIVLAAGMAPKT